MFTIAITGHRPSKLFGYDIHSVEYDRVRMEIMDRLIALCDKFGEITCLSGGALGIDTIFLETCQTLQDSGYQISCKLILPCKDYDRLWTQKDRDRLSLFKVIYPVQYITDRYTPTCIHQRNKLLVDEADLLLAVWDGSPSGTGKTVNYAKKCGKPIRIVPYK